MPYKRTLDEAVVHRVFALAERGEQDQIASFLHPDALIVPTLQPDQLLKADDFPSFVRDVVDQVPMHEASAHAVHALGEGQFVVEGRIRWSLSERGFSDSPAAWAIVVKDGLIFRMKGVPNAAAGAKVLHDDDWAPTGEEPSAR